MESRISKPKVFLSHSKADKEFIEKLYKDLTLCQIDPWLDSIEIRHGQPWLSSIFEDGLPTCDCILVYLTKNSISSEMVKKEIDVGVLQKLKNNTVSFIPYVDDKIIRDELRPDLQVLQAPVWNTDNYNTMLPRVVAEIWRSYLERKILDVSKNQKILRLEAELELEKLKSNQDGNIFKRGEEKDFEYITKQLDRTDIFTYLKKNMVDKSKQVNPVYASIIQNDENWKITKKIEKGVGILSLIPKLTSHYNDSYKNRNIERYIERTLPKNTEYEVYEVDCYPDLTNEFLMYGFVRHETIPRANKGGGLISFDTQKLVFTDKMERYKYWLAYNNLLQDKLIIS